MNIRAGEVDDGRSCDVIQLWACLKLLRSQNRKGAAGQVSRLSSSSVRECWLS
jgi:hypothetical protein